MGQLLAVLIVPPIVGLVTYFVVRFLWERDENDVNKDHLRNGLEEPKVADPPPASGFAIEPGEQAWIRSDRDTLRVTRRAQGRRNLGIKPILPSHRLTRDPEK